MRRLVIAMTLAACMAGLAVAQVDRPAPPHVRAVEQALDPSAAIEAYARAVAVAPHDLAVQRAFMHRMIELGVPELAGAQAAIVAEREPSNAQAWGVLAFTSLMADQTGDALDRAERALLLGPDDPFVLGVAGQIVGWFDVMGRYRDAPATQLARAADLRSRFSHQPAFAQAYLDATDAYQDVLETELEAPTTQAPAPLPEPQTVYVEPDYGTIYAPPIYSTPSYFYSGYASPVFHTAFLHIDLHRRHAFKHHHHHDKHLDHRHFDARRLRELKRLHDRKHDDDGKHEWRDRDWRDSDRDRGERQAVPERRDSRIQRPGEAPQRNLRIVRPDEPHPQNRWSGRIQRPSERPQQQQIVRPRNDGDRDGGRARFESHQEQRSSAQRAEPQRREVRTDRSVDSGRERAGHSRQAERSGRDGDSHRGGRSSGAEHRGSRR